MTENPVGMEDDEGDETHLTRGRASSLLHSRPAGFEDEEWAFEDQLKDRSDEQLDIDLQKTMDELESTRESMAAIAEKRLHLKR